MIALHKQSSSNRPFSSRFAGERSRFSSPTSSHVFSAGFGLAAGALSGVLFFAPAAWLAQGLREMSNGRVDLIEPSGTIWNGSAKLVLAGGSGSKDSVALPGRLHWTLRPHWDGARIQLNFPCCTPTPWQIGAHAAWGGADVSVSAPNSQWPATLLSGLGTPWNTMALDGTLVIKSKPMNVQIRSGRLTALTGEAQLDVLHASSRLSTLRPMGSYRLQLMGGEVPTIQLSTLEGALILVGTGQWVGQRLRFNGEASASPDSETALNNLLNIIGRRKGARSVMTIG